MMRALILLHRWLGVAFCLLFAMWFATGIVMHFVPFPALTEAQRFAGLGQIDLTRIGAVPVAAVAASGIAESHAATPDMQRSDGPIYIVSSATALKALRADDLGEGGVRSEPLALVIAVKYVWRLHLIGVNAVTVGSAPYDQWTVYSCASRRVDRRYL